MSNELFNPYVVQKYFGQNIITSKLQPAGKREIVGNALYVVAYIVCFGVAVATNDNIVGDVRYNFISQMRFCMQFYFVTIIFVQISLMTTLFRRKYVNSYHALVNHTGSLRKIGIKTSLSLRPILLKYFAVFASSLSMCIVDVYLFRSKYNVYYFIVHYLPSTALSVYLIGITSLMQICTSKFSAINEFLRSFARNDDPILAKYRTNKSGECPEKLIRPFPGEGQSVYKKMFVLHDEVSETVKVINKICGYDLTIFMIIATFDVLSFVYDICMDLSTRLKGAEVPARTIYAPEYWSLMSLLGVVFLIDAASDLMDNANATKKYLHRLRNLYPELNEHVEMFSLQLVHSRIQFTAANFFVLHRGIFYKLLSAWVTYIIIFMQLDTDIASVDA